MNCDLKIKVNTFNLKATLECGQCFRWKEIDLDEYIGVISDRVIRIKQANDDLLIWSNSKEGLREAIEEYFDLNKKYSVIEKNIAKVDCNIQKSIEFSSGIHILNQPLFETIISYIISANNNIKRISRSVNMIAEKFGKEVMFENEKYYLFPTAQELKKATIDDYLNCGVGFRAKYLKHTVEKICNTDILDKLQMYTTNEAYDSLITFMGIGPKVADCILLFSLKRGEVFPTDVWVKRVMEKLYFKKNTSLKEIKLYAEKIFKQNAGIIQQHLFYNVREGKL